MRRVFVSLLALLLAACGSSPDDTSASTSGAVDAPSASSTTQQAKVGFDGYGTLHFGMNRAAAEQAIGDRFAGPEETGACQELVRADEPDVTYLFLDGILQRIDVESSDVVAEGGGHVGMTIDDLHSLYSGRLSESASAEIPGGRRLELAGPKGSGIVFRTDGNGTVTAFHSAAATAMDRAEGCTP